MILTLFGERNAKGFAYYFAIGAALLMLFAVLERLGTLVVNIAKAVGEVAPYMDTLINLTILFFIMALIIFFFVAGSYLVGRTNRQAQKQLELEREEHRSEMAAIKAQLDSIQQMIGTHSDESEAEDGKVHTDD